MRQWLALRATVLFLSCVCGALAGATSSAGTTGAALASARAAVTPASAAAPSGAYPGGNGAIAFVHYSSAGGSTVWAMNPDGSAARRLVAPGVSPSVRSVAWSPDGRKLAFRDGNFGLHAVNADGSGHRVIADKAWPGKPSWAPSGEEVAALINVDGTLVLTAIRVDGSGRRELVPRSRLFSLEDFAWSSTGRLAVRLRYQSGHPDQGKVALVTMDVGGGNETVVFLPPHRGQRPVNSPSWSPDGSRIAFQLHDDVGEQSINVVDATGSNRRMLAVGREPAWSPDGTRIVYTTGNPSADWRDARVSLMNSDGSAKKELGRGMAADWQPCRAGATCRLPATPAPAPAPAPPRPKPLPFRGQLEAFVDDRSGNAILAVKRPGFLLNVTRLKAGRYTINVSDQSRRHNFHLVGVGANRQTSVDGTGRFRWNVTLKRGKLSVYSDRAPSLRYTATVIP